MSAIFEGITSCPLSWPAGHPRSEPENSRFARPTVYKATQFVYAELGRMGVESWQIILSTNMKLRLDGLPYSNQREPYDPGAAVYFNLDGEPHVLACDRWGRVACNLWAIGKHIEALRGQERWGVGSRKQAFAGFKLIGDGSRPWRAVLAYPDEDPITASLIQDRFIAVSLRCHPDRGGSDVLMAEVNAARAQALQEMQQ